VADYIVHKAIELDALSKKLQADIENHEYILSPKYDGCHVIFLFDKGRFVAARSRTDETVHSMDHIGRSLLDHYPEYLAFSKVAIMGEAWIPGVEFSEISGTFRRHAPQPHLGFVPFDTVTWRMDQAEDGRPVLGEFHHIKEGPLKDTRTYSERLAALRNRHDMVSLVHAPAAWGIKGNVLATATSEAKRYKELGGYDGCILARRDGRYQVGAGKGGEFIKIKPLISHTVKVNALFPDRGEKTGKNTLALGFTFNGLGQKVSTGLTQAEIDDPHRFLGKMIEVEAMGLTVNGLLREPRYKGIRTDVL
jgi:hypothetical protein